MRPYGIILENNTYVSLFRRNVNSLFSAVNACISNVNVSLFGFYKSTKATHQRCLSASGRPDYSHNLAIFYLKR